MRKSVLSEHICAIAAVQLFSLCCVRVPDCRGDVALFGGRIIEVDAGHDFAIGALDAARVAEVPSRAVVAEHNFTSPGLAFVVRDAGRVDQRGRDASRRSARCVRLRSASILCGRHSTRWIAGGAHSPVSTGGIGQYKRMVRLNCCFGAGSQLNSTSAPGDSFWM